MKIEKVVWQGTFAEAEERDDDYWAAQSEEERLNTLFEIRQILFEGAVTPIKKVAFIKKINEEE
ncbi:MAG: hypothetical protein IT256_03625 [Chitinophagaceae bacterium]|nr:hypothetical protein [Chitinophagaceae bacterium]